MVEAYFRISPQLFPDLFFDQSDLPAAALVGIAYQAATRYQLCRADRIHRAALHSFDPDFAEFAIVHNGGFYLIPGDFYVK